jgi:hypothetical protein
MYDKSGKIRSEYCYALKKAHNGGNKYLKRIDIKNNLNIDTGIRHPALDVADPHLLEENADFMRNY